MKFSFKGYVWRLVVLFGLLVGTLSAQVTFVVNATARYDLYGYTTGQSVTFSFVLSDSFSEYYDNVVQPSFTGARNFWCEVNGATSPLWTSVSGSGLVGSYTPSSSATVAVNKSDFALDGLSVSAINPDLNGKMGLSLPDNTQLRGIDAFFPGIADFNYPGYFSSPALFFNDHIGNYLPTSSLLSVTPVGSLSGVELFSVASLTISTGSASIPEPSTYTLMAGLMGLAGAFAFRRRRLGFRSDGNDSLEGV